MLKVSPLLELKSLCGGSCGSDLSGRPGDPVGGRCAGKTPTHPGSRDPASGIRWEQLVFGSVQVRLTQAPCSGRLFCSSTGVCNTRTIINWVAQLKLFHNKLLVCLHVRKIL